MLHNTNTSRDTDAVAIAEDMAKEVADRLDVAEVLSRYAQGWDTRDFELVKRCFTPDARIRYGTLPPFPGGFPEFFELERSTILQLKSTQHLIGNLHVTVDGDTAQCTSYVQASHYDDEGRQVWTTGGRYDDVLIRTPGGWRIADRTFTRQWIVDPDGRSHQFLAN
jgi:ketosteroid isomerase-like protein